MGVIRENGLRLMIGVALFTCAAVAPVPGAQANTVVVGSSFTAHNFVPISFGAPSTLTNFVLLPPATAASPVDGTVISWSFKGNGGPLTPRVLRSTGTTSLSAAGIGAPQSATAPPTGVSGPFPTVIPIMKGDYFGVDGQTGASLSSASLDGETSLKFTPALAEGAGDQAPTEVNPQEVAVSAIVRFCLVPKLKGKTAKAARQALLAADCTVGKVSKGKKRLPKRTVLAQSARARTSVSDTLPVDLTIAQKKKG